MAELSRKTVELYLTRSAESAAEAQPENHLPPRRAASGEVVVEDEPAVIDFAVESLGELGYRSRTATRASEALERLGGRERIDILFSVVAMPGGMNGVQLSIARPGACVCAYGCS